MRVISTFEFENYQTSQIQVVVRLCESSHMSQHLSEFTAVRRISTQIDIFHNLCGKNKIKAHNLNLPNLNEGPNLLTLYVGCTFALTH